MPRSPYDNVFHAFRGPSAKSVAAETPDVQLEDNVTKALINTLSMGRGDLLGSWLTDLNISASEIDPAEYRLQGSPPIDDVAVDSRYLVVITAGPVPAAPAVLSDNATGRVDASIAVPGQLALGIEAKVGAALDVAQLNRHAEELGLPITEPGADTFADGWLFTTWPAVHRWARTRLSGARLDPVGAFLVGQFVDYLEIQGLSNFAGFRAEDFAFLQQRRKAIGGVTGPSVTDPRQATVIKERLEGLWSAVVTGLSTPERLTLGEFHVGALKSTNDRLWSSSNWGSTQQNVNLTVEITPEHLEVDLVAWRAAQVAQLLAWIASDDYDQCRSKLQHLELVMWRRRALKSKYGKPFWMHESTVEVARVSLAEGTRLLPMIEAFCATLEPDWEFPAFHLRRSWSSDVVVDKGLGMVVEARDAVRDLVRMIWRIASAGAIPVDPSLLLHSTNRTWGALGIRLRQGTFDGNPPAEPEANGASDGPATWQVVAAGPSIMATSPSGMSLRGTRWFIAVDPGPGGSKPEFVALMVQKGYASGGRDGSLAVVERGSDLRRIVEAINGNLRIHMESMEGIPLQRNVAGIRDLRIDDVIEDLWNQRALTGGEWTDLDRLARTLMRTDPEPGWAAVDEPFIVSWMAPD